VQGSEGESELQPFQQVTYYPLLRDDLASLTPDRSIPVVLIKANVCRILEPLLSKDGLFTRSPYEEHSYFAEKSYDGQMRTWHDTWHQESYGYLEIGFSTKASP
jgi:hypothetical protein